jgi:hypothetical protein
MCRDTWVTGSRVDVARALRPVWRNDTIRRRQLRHRQSGPHERKHERESKHKIDYRFHSYPDLLEIVLSSEETESPVLGPSLFEFSAGIRIPLGNELVPSAHFEGIQKKQSTTVSALWLCPGTIETPLATSSGPVLLKPTHHTSSVIVIA